MLIGAKVGYPVLIVVTLVWFCVVVPLLEHWETLLWRWRTRRRSR
jgi:hypothetical protein